MRLKIRYLGKEEEIETCEKFSDFIKKVKKVFNIWEKFNISFSLKSNDVKYKKMKEKSSFTYDVNIVQICEMKERLEKKQDKLIEDSRRKFVKAINSQMEEMNTILLKLQNKIIGNVLSIRFIINQTPLHYIKGENEEKEITIENNGKSTWPNGLYLCPLIGDILFENFHNIKPLEPGKSQTIKLKIKIKNSAEKKGRLFQVIGKLYGFKELSDMDILFSFFIKVVYCLEKKEEKNKGKVIETKMKNNLKEIIRGLTKVRGMDYDGTYERLKNLEESELVKEVYKLGATPIEC